MHPNPMRRASTDDQSVSPRLARTLRHRRCCAQTADAHPTRPGLDDTYTVYRGVHWTHVEWNRYAIFGGIDFAIVGPGGDPARIVDTAK
jgi:hypothetical protein